VEYRGEEIILNNSEYLLDVISFHDVRSTAHHETYSIVFKRTLWISKPDDFLANHSLLDFVFHQTKANYLEGYLELKTKDLIFLASALLMKIAFQTKIDPSKEKIFRIFLPWDIYGELSEKEWLKGIEGEYSQLFSSSNPNDNQQTAMKSFVSLFTKSPYFGCWFTRISIAGKRKLVLGVNKNGLSFIHEKSKALISAFSYSEIQDLYDEGTNQLLLVLHQKQQSSSSSTTTTNSNSSTNNNSKKSLKIIGSQVRQIERMVKLYLAAKSAPKRFE